MGRVGRFFGGLLGLVVAFAYAACQLRSLAKAIVMPHPDERHFWVGPNEKHEVTHCFFCKTGWTQEKETHRCKTLN